MKLLPLTIMALLLSNAVKSQVGINTDVPKTTLDIVAKTTSGTNVEGVLIPRVSRVKAETMTNIENSTLVYINDISLGSGSNTVIPSKTTSVGAVGYYFYDSLRNKWISINYKANFLYSPTILLPTSPDDTRISATGYYRYNSSTGVYYVDVYSIFKNQFEDPIASSTNAVNNPHLVRHVKERSEYDYYVTYADSSVFLNPRTEIQFSDDGILSYKVIENSIIRNGSFMNIVLKEF